jgi:hypothetical protein
MFDCWLNIAAGIIILLLFLFGLLQLWFWVDRQPEIKEANRVMKELTENNTPKLSKEEQFNFIDIGNWWKIKRILGEKYDLSHVLEYFIDIEPNEYFEHLKKNNPPSSWNEEPYGYAEIKKIKNRFIIIDYWLGKKTNSKSFDDYDKLLKYLVYKRLINIGRKYKKTIKRSYYA